MGAEAWVAIYAAIVATGALTLEVRRWFESGPKIVVKARPNMTMVDGPKHVTKGVLVVDAVNRGSASTTIETLALLDFPSIWARMRMAPRQSFIVPNPVLEGAVGRPPFVLQPGSKWTGIAYDRADVTGDIQTGTFWAAVYTTDRNKPYLAKVPKPQLKKELVNATEV